ncbi:GNAT family N-acetyltransferase [Microvirga sp. GCM10011540]|uniref:GNAT family N-acetyltransferase n=1 Tax=Microvirga sp. GCM10011540 TaxID=3317338 RepID=UPI003621A9A6
MPSQANTPVNQFSPEGRTSDVNRGSSDSPTFVDDAQKVDVQTAGIGDQSRLVAAIVLSFSVDPAARWTYPAPENYLQHFPDLVRIFGHRAFECGTAHFIGDAQAAALWLPPGVQPDEMALMAHFQRTVPQQDQDTLFAVFEQMGQYHPNEPYWYLPLIGVDPAQQGKGYGSALLKHALRRCDEDGTPAYLESSNPKNIPLYQRHGFEVLGRIWARIRPFSPLIALGSMHTRRIKPLPSRIRHKCRSQDNG